MTQPNPPQELQVQPAPQAPVEPQAPQQMQEAQPAPDPGPPEDRTLTPQETINYFRTGNIEDPNVPADAGEREQADMAADFFQGIPPDSPQAPREPGQPVPQAQQPQQLPQQVADAAVAADYRPQAPQQVPVQAQVPQQQVQVPPQQQVPQQQVPQQQVPQQLPPTPGEAALQAQVLQLTQQVQGLTQNIATQQVKQGVTEPQQQAQQFNFQVPAQYADAIAGEDPNLRVQAINQLLNGVAQSVHQQTLKDVDTRIQGITPVVQRQVQEAQSQADIKRDMYGTYPELSSMPDMVVAAASQLQAQYGPWSPDYRDAIAERLAPMIPGLSQKVAQHRAARGVNYAPQQFLPQVPQPQQLPPGVTPTQVQGGVHVQAGQPQPVIVRDAQGNYSQVYPQHQQQVAGGAQTRPNGAQGVDPALLDVWTTLGFA